MTTATQPPSEFAAAHGSEPNYDGASTRRGGFMAGRVVCGRCEKNFPKQQRFS